MRTDEEIQKLTGHTTDYEPKDNQINYSLREVRAIAKAQRDLTINRYRQAVKDAMVGKELDLTEEEFEVFSAIQNSMVTIKDAEYTKDYEHMRHLIDDVIILEQKLKDKDAECQQRVDAARLEERERIIDYLREHYGGVGTNASRKTAYRIAKSMAINLLLEDTKKQEGE